MAIQFSEGTLIFPTGFTGDVARADDTKIFSTRVKTDHVIMRGYDMGFKSKDRPLHEIQAQLSATIDSMNPIAVRVNGLLLLRDFSGNIDDPYQGNIDYLVIAEV